MDRALPAFAPPGAAAAGLSLTRPEIWAAASLVAVCFLACVAPPLAAYLATIALFGLAHVGAELRFVDRAFAGRLPKMLVVGIAAPLAVAFAARLAGQLGMAAPSLTVPLELASGAVMACVAATAMRQRRLFGAALAAALVAGAVFAPYETFLLLAIGHNFTPLAFIADGAPASRRRSLLLWLCLPFVVLPLIIASGLPGAAFEAIGLFAPEAGPMAAGPLDAHLSVYVPARLLDSQWALPLFSACVFAQTMHYATVIHLLPRLVGEGPRATLAPWPRRSVFLLGLAACAAALAGVFLADYGLARKIYALAALVHSWIEIPILIWALDRSAIAAAADGR